MTLRIFFALLGVLAVFGLLWVMWPSPIMATYWDEPVPDALDPSIVQDEALGAAEVFPVGVYGAAEGLTVASDGTVYFGTADGVIRRLLMGRAGSGPATSEVVTRVAPEPIMSLDWAAPGVLAIASRGGIYALDLGQARVERLSSGVPARPFGFANDLAVGDDGTIYFTDSSAAWGHGSNNPGAFYDMLENRPNGALYAWSPATRQTHLLRDRLYYPNGIALSPDGDALLVAETFRYRIVRLWIDGPREGQLDILRDNLPGLPDGLTVSRDGKLLVAMGTGRAPLLTYLRRHPRLANLAVKLPAWMRPDGTGAKPFILVLDAGDGEILASLDDPADELCLISNIAEAPDRALWFGSTNCGYVARLDAQARATD